MLKYFGRRRGKPHSLRPAVPRHDKLRRLPAVEPLESRWLLTGSYIVTDLGTLPGNFATDPASGPTATSSADSINAFGQVAGNADVPSGAGHGFLYSNGTLQDIGLLPGGTGTTVSQVNDNGQVVGAANTYYGVEHAYIYSGGVMHDLGSLGGSASYAYGINDSGQVVGAAQLAGGSDHAFLYSGGVMHDLGALAGPWSAANAINASGEVVGGTDTTANVHAFLYSNGAMHDLGFLPRGTYSLAVGINDIGQVVGYADVGTSYMFAFLYSNGVMQDLGTLPTGVDSFAVDINDAGQVVGYAQLANGSQHAFLYSGGKMVDLNSLIDPSSGWTLMDAAGINGAGQIVGYGTNPAGQSHAFLLTPVAPPRVTNLQISSTSWSAGFLSSLQATGAGNGSGYAVPVGGSGAELTDLPWTNVNQIQIQFSENVNVQQDSLSVTGINVAQYQVASFTYNSATFTATWTLTKPMGADRVSIDLASTGPAAVTDATGQALDGDWTTGTSAFPSGNGAAGTDFMFGLNVLPADVAQRWHGERAGHSDPGGALAANGHGYGRQ